MHRPQDGQRQAEAAGEAYRWGRTEFLQAVSIARLRDENDPGEHRR